MSGKGKEEWVKNLYTKTGLADNFTPGDCFLAAIQRNKNVRGHTFSECLEAACQVNMQLCAVLIFAVAYVFLDEGQADWSEIIATSAATTTAGYFACSGMSPRLSDARYVVIFLAMGLGLAPVLYKLTDTISTDTIHTTSSVMLFLHLLFHDYRHSLGPATYYTNPLSLNAALFAAVCLASRLNSSLDAFALITVSVSAFALFPVLRAKLDGALSVGAAAACSVAVLATCANVSVGFAASAASSLFFVTVASPWLFVRWQRHKDTIHGPWDEAIPKIAD